MKHRFRTFTVELARSCAGIGSVYLASKWTGAVGAALVSAPWFVGMAWRSSSLDRAVVSLRRLSRTDDLTGLENDRSFREALSRGCAGLILFDLDGFKSFNDTFGHPAGDEGLRTLGRILEGETSAYRIGGDEFAMILDRPQKEIFAELAMSIRDRIRAYPWPTRRITASFGVASAGPNLDPVDLRARADRALYQAKQLGGDQVVAWERGEPQVS